MGRGTGRSLLSTSRSYGSWKCGTCNWFPEVALALLKALEMRRWAKELKSLNHGYKWKRVFEMFSGEAAEKQKRLEMF